jgi:dolichyl-phosphate-mannose--protein O-mannosyl transferase
MSLASSKRWLFFILLFSFGIRFIGLNQIDGPVFDEVFYPKYGLMYLKGEDFYYAHPPLANYLYAFAIWVYSLLPWTGIESLQNIELSSLQPISYRWINALLGSLLCLVIYGISFQLTKKKLYALIATSLVVLDGSLIVDSRIALANTFLVFFGFSGLYFFLRFYIQNGSVHNLVFSGLLMGMTVSIKWSGLGFVLLALMIVILLKN